MTRIHPLRGSTTIGALQLVNFTSGWNPVMAGAIMVDVAGDRPSVVQSNTRFTVWFCGAHDATETTVNLPGAT
jgi:hypothetical protein